MALCKSFSVDRSFLSSTTLHKLQQSLKQKMEGCKCYHIMHSVTVPLHSAITFWVNFVIKGLTGWSHFWFLAQGHASYVGAVSYLCIQGFLKNNKFRPLETFIHQFCFVLLFVVG